MIKNLVTWAGKEENAYSNIHLRYPSLLFSWIERERVIKNKTKGSCFDIQILCRLLNSKYMMADRIIMTTIKE